MTDDRKKKITDFYNGLTRAREQVSDKGLLDESQQYLGELLGLVESPPDEPEKEEK